MWWGSFSFYESELTMSTFANEQQVKLKEQIKELFFAAGNNVLKPIVQKLNDVYPSSKRLKNLPTFSQEIFDEHDTKFRRARNHLYEQRNLVQKKWLLRYNVSTGPIKDAIATAEMRSVIVEGALDRLYETLIAYLPMLVPAEHQKPLMAVVTNIFHMESKKLTEAMGKYSAQFSDGVESMDKELD
jgi:hypothetical protein